MAARIEPNSVQATALLRRPVPPGWLWSADGTELWFYDAPPNDPAGTWAVNIDSGERRPVTQLWGQFSSSRRYVFVAEPVHGNTTVHDRDAGESWTLQGTGERLLPNADETEVAFGIRQPGFDPAWMRPADFFRMRLDGSERVEIDHLIGSVVGWRSDGNLLIAGRETLDSPTVIRILDRSGTLLDEWPLGARARGLQLSPSGRFLAYTAVLGAAGDNGHFLLDLVRGTRSSVPGPVSLRWLPDESGLLIIPTRRRAGRPFRIWRMSLPRLIVEEPLTDPLEQPVELESFDWQVSPRGEALAFRTARTLHLRLVTWNELESAPDPGVESAPLV